MMRSVQQLALAHMSARELVSLAQAAVDRPERTSALGIDFYRPNHRNLPHDRMRFCIARFEWRGSRWRRVYKHTGPLTIDVAQDYLKRLSKRLGHPIIDQA